MSYQPKVYREQGGAKQVHASGGEGEFQSGSTLDIQDGAQADCTVTKVVTLSATSGAAGLCSISNPASAELLITTFAIILSGGATGTADFGVATGGSANNLIDGVAITATGLFSNHDNGATGGLGVVLWPSGQKITGSASGAVSGLAGKAIISYIRTSDV